MVQKGNGPGQKLEGKQEGRRKNQEKGRRRNAEAGTETKPTATNGLISQSFVVAFVYPAYVRIALIWGFPAQLSL